VLTAGSVGSELMIFVQRAAHSRNLSLFSSLVADGELTADVANATHGSPLKFRIRLNIGAWPSPFASAVEPKSLYALRRPGTHLAAFSSVDIRPGILPRRPCVSTPRVALRRQART
jgi:hypothetical protein